MRKLLLIFVMIFIFIGHVDAKSIEQKLRELNDNVNKVEEKINDLEKTKLDKMYPVGSIYISTVYSSVSEVKNAIGGTWETYGSGKTLFGVNTADSNFNVSEKTGGVSSVSLNTNNLSNHSHSIPQLSGTANAGTTAATGGNHTHNFLYNNNKFVGFPYSKTGGSYINFFGGDKAVSGITNDAIRTTVATAGAHTHTVTTNANTTESSGSSTSFTNLSPYITVYMYKRVG